MFALISGEHMPNPLTFLAVFGLVGEQCFNLT